MQKLAENIQLQTITEDGIRTVYIRCGIENYLKNETDWYIRAAIRMRPDKIVMVMK